jgi:hypothetical protein
MFPLRQRGCTSNSPVRAPNPANQETSRLLQQDERFQRHNSSPLATAASEREIATMTSNIRRSNHRTASVAGSCVWTATSQTVQPVTRTDVVLSADTLPAKMTTTTTTTRPHRRIHVSYDACARPMFTEGPMAHVNSRRYTSCGRRARRGAPRQQGKRSPFTSPEVGNENGLQRRARQ